MTQQGAVSLRGLGAVVLPDDDAAAIDRLVQQAAYFSLFSTPNPETPTRGIPLIPFVGQALSIAFSVNEEMHRFEVHQSLPSPVCGLHITQEVGTQPASKVQMQMTPMPNNFQAADDRVPPPTLLLPFLSQRFCALRGHLEFLDSEGSGLRAFGTGHTFPATVAGQARTRLAGVLDILEGQGKLAGLHGTGIVNGDIQPPGGFAFNVLFRIIDSDAKLQARTPVQPLQSAGDPAPDMAFMPFISEPDPDYPIQVELGPSGRHVRLRVVERLRLVDLNFSEELPGGLRSQTTPGALVGRHSTTMILDMSTSEDVIPAYSQGGEFSFADKDGKRIGGFKADLFEARVFPTLLPGLRTPILRIGGFAPPTQGTGQFTEPVGMVSVNGALSLATGMISTLYMVRLSDPFRIFRAAAS